MKRFFFAIVFLFLAFLLATAADPVVPAKSFPDQVKESFAKWDRDHNGTLTHEEVDHSVSDASIKGSEAAAVAALKRAVRSTKYKLPELTKESVLKLAESKASAETPDLNAFHNTAAKKIATANRELFANGKPTFNDLHQGKLGDCFCLAPLGAMISRDPEDVAKMITRKDEHTFVVKLGTKQMTVPAPTDAEIALLATTGADGIWVNVYEKAIGMNRTEKAKAEGTPNASLIDLLAKGGSAGTTLELITGHPIERFSCKFAKDTKLSDAEKAATLAEFRKKLAASFAEKRLVTCGTVSGVTTPNINGNHAYAITGYDAKADRMTIWNPHGQSFTPKDKPGITSGYVTKNGRFEIPTEDFVKTFAGVAFEVITVR